MSERSEIRQPVKPSNLLHERTPEMATELTRQTTNIEEDLAAAMLGLKSDQQKRLLDALHAFGNGLFTRASSQNHRNPERIITVLEGAAALLQPEPDQVGRGSARAMKEALERRYGEL